MNNKVLDLLKERDYVVPSFLIKEYKKLLLSSDDVIMIIYLINIDNPIVCDYQKISNDLNIDVVSVMSKINTLKEKNILSIEVKKNMYSKLEEYINLDLFYEKVFLEFIDNKEVIDNSIYSTFETELGRTLSPIEYELLNSWNAKYEKDIIIEALKEAVISNVRNFRYIDRILFEWEKKGINSIDKLEKNRNKRSTNNSVDIPDLDWLNSSE